ncbi:Arm DNA-binding domain-containing protein [Pseudomonas lini]|uniref:Uncharacterized protein n=1 Tax=Pseudomonas lini TaxID=163011 RepID=A0A423IJJ4_9PSED|nr:Arm DNA-binding domain-containing protein [Pseudomonas lini]RON25621.1 hypothetical protein BK663_19340 [Pseudomonas lini]
MDAELDSKAPAALQLKTRPYKTAISQRRYLPTMPTGFKLCRFKLNFERREKALTVGAFPAATLAQASNDTRATFGAGINPSTTRKAERAEHFILRPRTKGVRLVMTLENSLTIGTPRQILNLTPKQIAAVRAFLLAVETEGTRHAAD